MTSVAALLEAERLRRRALEELGARRERVVLAMVQGLGSSGLRRRRSWPRLLDLGQEDAALVREACAGVLAWEADVAARFDPRRVRGRP